MEVLRRDVPGEGSSGLLDSGTARRIASTASLSDHDPGRTPPGNGPGAGAVPAQCASFAGAADGGRAGCPRDRGGTSVEDDPVDRLRRPPALVPDRPQRAQVRRKGQFQQDGLLEESCNRRGRGPGRVPASTRRSCCFGIPQAWSWDFPSRACAPDSDREQDRSERWITSPTVRRHPGAARGERALSSPWLSCPCG